MTTSETAWLAGLLEGEGCFRTTPTTARIDLWMTDQDVIENVARIVERRRPVLTREVQRKKPGKPYKPQWGLVICGREAMRIMSAILPHMGARRSARIREIMAIYPILRQAGRAKRDKVITPEFMAAIGRKGLAVRWGTPASTAYVKK